MRTLVLGIPLPHVTFDNYSFLSAPSLFDYGRVIVETSALSEAIGQVAAGSTEHKTHGGLTIVNGPGGPAAFSLAELLRRPPGPPASSRGKGSTPAGPWACWRPRSPWHSPGKTLAPPSSSTSAPFP